MTDEMLRPAPAAHSAQERLQLFYEAETILLERVAVIPIYTYNNKHLVHAGVTGLPSNILDQRNFRYVSLESSHHRSGED